jgi:V8-like Glu-specific endopeptidase
MLSQTKEKFMTDKKDIPQSPESDASLDDLKEFWTPERMKEAIPAPHEPSPDSQKDAQREFDETPAKKAPQEPPKPPERDARAQGVRSFSAVPVQNAQVFPYCTTGKLFYTQGGNSYTASGAVIYNNTILTAAHVLFNYGLKQWAQNILFVPAYLNGAAPLGSWQVAVSYTLPGYNTTGNDAYDVGMGTITPAGIAKTTGYLGMVVNQGWAGLVWQALGYPAAPTPPYNGQQMWSCTGPSTGLDPDGTMAVGMQSNFTTGASGGPWLRGGQANGLSSYGHPNVPNIEYSPYFDNAVWQMYLQVRS